jgi:hypothetical protein
LYRLSRYAVVKVKYPLVLDAPVLKPRTKYWVVSAIARYSTVRSKTRAKRRTRATIRTNKTRATRRTRTRATIRRIKTRATRRIRTRATRRRIKTRAKRRTRTTRRRIKTRATKTRFSDARANTQSLKLLT